MLKSELKRIQHLAKKNAEKAAKEIREMEKKGLQNENLKQLEKVKVNEDLDADSATKLFQEMKVREF